MVYEIDGRGFSTLEGFFDVVWPLLAGEPSSDDTNLDAFNDILSWPEEPYCLVWKNSEFSRSSRSRCDGVRSHSRGHAGDRGAVRTSSGA